MSSPASVAFPAGAAPAQVRVGRKPHVPRHSRNRPIQSHAPLLVRTITRIVNVIPKMVWILLGALLALAFALAARSRLAALRSRRLERQRGELLEDVGLLQAALLPVLPVQLGPVGLSAAYQPADGPAAGGDFYDVFALEDGLLAAIVGDVSGHGRQALPHTALARFTLRAYLEAGLLPREAVQTAGSVLERQLGESFATVVVATYQPRERIFTYACAGHPPPLVLGSKSIAPIVACSAPPLGTGLRTGTRQTVMSVPGRAQICLYTDGVTEARVGSELYGTERLSSALAALGRQATAPALLDAVATESDGRPDDMASCMLSVEGGEDPPEVLSEELELDRQDLAGERTERFLQACGIQHEQIAELVRSAQDLPGRPGTVLLRVHRAGKAPRATLLHNNVTSLHTAQVSRPMALGASQ